MRCLFCPTSSSRTMPVPLPFQWIAYVCPKCQKRLGQYYDDAVSLEQDKFEECACEGSA